jgi:acyl dehydratase
MWPAGRHRDGPREGRFQPVTLFESVDLLRPAIGSHLGLSAWRAVTQTQVDDFARATGDHQWIHVDPERAATGPFGGPIAHGYLTLSLVPVLVAEVFEVRNVEMGINYGCNKVRFPAPVHVGSRVRAGAELLDVVAAGAGALVTLLVTVLTDRDEERPACVAEVVSYLVPTT